MKKIVAVAVALLLTSQAFAQDYSSLHKLVIKFYGYQRAGLKSGDNGNLNKMNVHKGDVYKVMLLMAGGMMRETISSLVCLYLILCTVC